VKIVGVLLDADLHGRLRHQVMQMEQSLQVAGGSKRESVLQPEKNQRRKPRVPLEEQ